MLLNFLCVFNVFSRRRGVISFKNILNDSTIFLDIIFYTFNAKKTQQLLLKASTKISLIWVGLIVTNYLIYLEWHNDLIAFCISLVEYLLLKLL